MSLFSATSLPKLTLFFCALFLIVYLAQSIRVIYFRFKEQVALGQNQKSEKSKLNRLIRIHANFNEYVPLFLVTFGLLEMSGFQREYLTPVGCAMILGRTLHWFGLEKTHLSSFGRGAGMFLTFSSYITLIIYILLRLNK